MKRPAAPLSNSCRVSAVFQAVLIFAGVGVLRVSAQPECGLASQLLPEPSGACADPAYRYWGYYPIGANSTGSDCSQRPFTWLNLNPAVGPNSGDFPPLSTDLIASTSPLASANAAKAARSASYPERATLNGVIDLMTAAPLIREVDFELPFGGAVFRHIRTYSEPVIRQGVGVGGAGTNVYGQEWWGQEGSVWDWNGMGWMMSENPVFLMDSSYSYNHTWEGQSPVPKRCYLIPDATHAIPFVWEPVAGGGGRYVAPPCLMRRAS